MFQQQIEQRKRLGAQHCARPIRGNDLTAHGIKHTSPKADPPGCLHLDLTPVGIKNDTTQFVYGMCLAASMKSR
jgi:hypothetical protein